jgi:hypothetical protein
MTNRFHPVSRVKPAVQAEGALRDGIAGEVEPARDLAMSRAAGQAPHHPVLALEADTMTAAEPSSSTPGPARWTSNASGNAHQEISSRSTTRTESFCSADVPSIPRPPGAGALPVSRLPGISFLILRGISARDGEVIASSPPGPTLAERACSTAGRQWLFDGSTILSTDLSVVKEGEPAGASPVTRNSLPAQEGPQRALHSRTVVCCICRQKP